MSRRPIPASIRERVAKAARYRCGYCLTSQHVIGPLLEIDHLVPEARGGTSHEHNLWLACPLCNSHKADRTNAVDPTTHETVPHLNDETVVVARGLWVTVGWHPPKDVET
ncbi:MAG: HNH endonuclease [Chloroflexota bacterium]